MTTKGPSPMPGEAERITLEERERDEFESWMASSNYPEIADIALARIAGGHYKSQITHAAWQTWLARARVVRSLESQLSEARREERERIVQKITTELDAAKADDELLDDWDGGIVAGLGRALRAIAALPDTPSQKENPG